MTRDGSDGADGDGEARAERLARDLDALRQGLEADPPLPPDEVRRRVEAIADEVLALGAGGGPTSGPIGRSSPDGVAE